MTDQADRRTFYPAPFTGYQSVALLLLLLIAAALRFHDLDAESLWYDESLSALFASQPYHTALTSMLEEGLQHSPLYYLLLRPFAAGEFNEFSLRVLPGLLGLLTIPVIAQLGRLIAGPRAGLIAAALLTIDPFHVWYSRETRMYTLVALGAALAMYYFVYIVLYRPKLRHWLGLAVGVAIGINTHHFAFFIPLAQFVFIIVSFRRTYPLLRPWVAAQVLAGLSLIPWLITVMNWGEFYGTSGSASITPTVLDGVKLVWNFSLGYTEQVTIPVVLGLGLVFALLAYTLHFLFLSPQPENVKMATGLLWVWFVLPPAVTLALSLRLPMYVDRYMIVSLPAFVLLMAVSLDRIPRQSVRRLAMAGVLAAMLWGTGRIYTDDAIYERADWRAVAAYLEEYVDPAQDQIATKNYQDLIPFYFYYDGSVPIGPLVSFNQVSPPALPSPDSGRRFWLVIPHKNVSIHLVGHCQDFDAAMFESTPELWAWYTASQDRLVAVIEFTCIRVEVYE